jgi:hypothetical protein
LLSLVGAALWQRRAGGGRRLGRADLEAIGGVAGALVAHAEARLAAAPAGARSVDTVIAELRAAGLVAAGDGDPVELAGWAALVDARCAALEASRRADRRRRAARWLVGGTIALLAAALAALAALG